MDKIIVRERVFIPKDTIDIENVEKFYKRKEYKDADCQACPYKADRHSYMCDECSAYLGETRLFNEEVIKGVEYIGLPIGDKAKLEKRIGFSYRDFKIIDKRVVQPFAHKIKFTIDLYDYQEKLKASFMKKKYGLLEAPPRTGKTATMLSIGIDLGQRILFLADQHEFITQFLDHIHGNEKEGIPKCTNLPELQEKTGKKLYGYPETDEDFENFQIFAMTYQQFADRLKSGRDRFLRLSPHIGTVMVDEVHSAAAKEFARAVGMWRARYRFGVTGTVNRKDGKQWIIKSIIGPVVARTKIEALVPKVRVYRCPSITTKARAWVFIMKALCDNKARNKMIVDHIVKDLKRGRNIVVPITFRKHALELQRMVNQQYGSHICDLFVGGGGKKNKEDRKRILQQCRAGTTRCVIGIRRLIQRGLNVKQWDTIYEIIPISNEPNLKQETARICTPLEGKKIPMIRWFVDMDVGASVGCARSSINHMRKFKYKFHKKSSGIIQEILSRGNRRRTNPEDEPAFDLLEFEARQAGGSGKSDGAPKPSRKAMLSF